MRKIQILKSVFFIFLLFICPGLIYSQAVKVSGKIYAADTPVKNAEVYITNQADSLLKFSTVTDSLGYYELNIIITSVNENKPSIPAGFVLEQNYPNPFSSKTNISYSIASQSDISINIYDILGQEVKRFSPGTQGSGSHGVIWDGTDNFNRKVSPGIYFYKMDSGKETIVKKMVFNPAAHPAVNSIKAYSNSDIIHVKKEKQLSGTALFNLHILNTSAAVPQIHDTLIGNISFHSDTVMNFNVSEIETERNVNLSGTIYAGLRKIQYARLSFTNLADTTKKFTTMTDTSGSFSMNVSYRLADSLFKLEIINLAETKPEIYNDASDSVNLQKDTVFNFRIESVGPWRKMKRNIPSGLRDLDFPDSLNGWVVGFYGILNTTDGGETWNEQIYPLEDHLTLVDFADDKNGWICSNESSILKTTDGGNTWNVIFHDDSGSAPLFYDMQFLNKDVGFIVGGEKYPALEQIIMRTTDGGETWSKIIKEDEYPLAHISIVNERNIWICGYGNILFSSDTGITWETKNDNLNAFCLNNIQFIDETYGFTACDENESWPNQFSRTTDGGNSWTSGPREIYLLLGVKTMCFTDSLNGWLGLILTTGQKAIINTTDGGRTWNFLPEDTILSGVQSIFFINKHLGWAIGSEHNQGVILRYIKPSISEKQQN